MADQAESVGHELMLKVRVGSCWATGGQVGEARGEKGKTASVTPTDMEEYDEFLRALVERYGARGVTEWAIENEINNTAQWAGTPAEYAALVEHAAGVIRAAQPGRRHPRLRPVEPDDGHRHRARPAAQGKDDEALEAYQRYYARRHTSRTRDYPALTTQEELQALIATREVAVQPRGHRGHARHWPRTASSTVCRCTSTSVGTPRRS